MENDLPTKKEWKRIRDQVKQRRWSKMGVFRVITKQERESFRQKKYLLTGERRPTKWLVR